MNKEARAVDNPSVESSSDFTPTFSDITHLTNIERISPPLIFSGNDELSREGWTDFDSQTEADQQTVMTSKFVEMDPKKPALSTSPTKTTKDDNHPSPKNPPSPTQAVGDWPPPPPPIIAPFETSQPLEPSSPKSPSITSIPPSHTPILPQPPPHAHAPDCPSRASPVMHAPDCKAKKLERFNERSPSPVYSCEKGATPPPTSESDVQESRKDWVAFELQNEVSQHNSVTENEVDISEPKETENLVGTPSKVQQEAPEAKTNSVTDRNKSPTTLSGADNLSFDSQTEGTIVLEDPTAAQELVAPEFRSELEGVVKRMAGVVDPYTEEMQEKSNYASEEDDLQGEVDGIDKYRTYNWFRPALRKNNLPPPNSGCADRLKYAISCPPHGKLGRALTWFVLFLLLWGSLASVTGDAALPGGNLFTILVLFILAKLFGMAVELVKIPPLLGMLVVGIILSSIPEMGISEAIDTEWSGSLRSMALTVILLMAGLGLDPAALKRLSLMVFRLAFTPCLVEASVVATCTHFLLGFPWLWGFMLGFVLGAVTPAVVVPCLLSLSERGYGVDKGIPTLVIAASSVDDVLAISGFGVLLGLVFSKGDSMTWQFIQGPIEVAMGIAFGGIMGTLAWVLPNRSFEDKDRLRFFYLIGSGLVAVFGSEKVGFPGAGALGCLSMAFVAGIGWRRQGMLDDNPTNDMLNSVWEIFEPLLFVLIGTEIKVGELKMETVGWGVLILFISLSFRMVTSFIVVMGGGLTLKERLFVSFAWLPKATVQAAVGSKALDYARTNLNTIKMERFPNNEQLAAANVDVELGTQVLTIAVLSILITAPIGAIAIMLTGPSLLSRSTGTVKNAEESNTSV